MAISNHLQPGMIISIKNKLYRVESCMKVTVPKGAPFIKTKLKDLDSNKVIEKNFKLDQTIKEVNLAQRQLEYLYLEGKDYLFLDIENLEHVLVPHQVIEAKSNYLKEGVEVTASFYGSTIFTVDLPQFLELMISKTEEEKGSANDTQGTRVAVLETGAKVEVPSFIETGDIIKIDTRTDEYIQRV
jgi:elongation factor P